MIHVSNLSKSFRDKRVLNNISFDVPGGSIVGLLGPSGAGKTTMIKILTGQLNYDGGSVRVFNEEGGADENAGTEARNLTGRDKLRFGILMDQFWSVRTLKLCRKSEGFCGYIWCSSQ